jgi:MFS family permease
MTRNQRWTLIVVCAATAMLMLDIALVNTALSAIAADLDTGLSGLQWVVDAYTISLAATVITAGSLADRFGLRRFFGIGLGIFTVTSLLCATAQSITMLNTWRAVQGVGAAVMFAVSLAVLSNAFPRTDQRVRALAAYGATMGGSFAIGPLVGGGSRRHSTGDGSFSSTCRSACCVCGSCGGSSPRRRTRALLVSTDPASSP